MAATTGIRAGANTSDTRLAFVKETAWSETPTEPAFTNLRLTSENMQWAKETVRSNEIRPDRNIVDEIQVSRSSAGNVDFELSYGAFDDLIESAMFSEWATNKIKNGADAGHSFTVERRLALPDASFEYHRFIGQVAGMAVEIGTGPFGHRLANVPGRDKIAPAVAGRGHGEGGFTGKSDDHAVGAFAERHFREAGSGVVCIGLSGKSHHATLPSMQSAATSSAETGCITARV